MSWLPTIVALWILVLLSAVVINGIVTRQPFVDAVAVLMPLASLAAGFFLSANVVRAWKRRQNGNGQNGDY